MLDLWSCVGWTTELHMHIMHELVCCKLYIVISMFIVFVNLCICLYVICDCVWASMWIITTRELLVLNCIWFWNKNHYWYLLLVAVLNSGSRTTAENSRLSAMAHLQWFRNHNWWQLQTVVDDLLYNSGHKSNQATISVRSARPRQIQAAATHSVRQVLNEYHTRMSNPVLSTAWALDCWHGRQ
jgi:hypothetical protein